MHKNEIYDYLAKTYFSETREGRLNKNANKKARSFLSKKSLILTLSIAAIFLTSLIILLAIFKKPSKSNAEIVSYNINLPGEAIKINYNFLPQQTSLDKIGYTLELGSIDVRNFKSLSLNAKKGKNNIPISLRIDILNKHNEIDSIYIPEITNKWNNFILDLSRLKKLKDLSTLTKIIFSIERWNAEEGENTILLENIKFIK